MRTTHWKLFPGFCLGLLVMLAVGCVVSAAFGTVPALRKLHWGVWLALTVLFPILALILYGKGEQIRSLYLLSYFTNAVGAGIAFGIALGFLEVPVLAPVVSMLLVSMAFPAGLAGLMCLVCMVCRRDRIVTITFVFLGIAAVICSFLFLVKWNPLIAFGASFGLLFFLAFPIACGKTLSKPWGAVEYLALSGFGAYLIVLVGAVCVLLEDGPGELFEGLFEGIADGADWATEPKQQKQQPRR